MGDVVIVVLTLLLFAAGVLGYVLGRADEKADREMDDLCRAIDRATWRSREEVEK